MKLTSADVAGFVGGQAEIQNQVERYLFRGEIESIVVEDGDLKIKFSWMAKGEGFPPLPNKWVKEDNLDYSASLEIYSVSNIGPGTEGGDRMCLNSMIVGENVILYPPDGSKLDSAKVEGLAPEKKKRPFHESVVDAISVASSAELESLATLIKATKIPKGHDEIVDAWKKRAEEMCMGDDLGVPADVLSQKQYADKETREKTWPLNEAD